MRQSANVLQNEIYYDTLKDANVYVDSIQNTQKGQYVHYKNTSTNQWGRKSIADFTARFKLTSPIGQGVPAKTVPKAPKAKPMPKIDTVSNSYTNVIFVDFKAKTVIK